MDKMHVAVTLANDTTMKGLVIPHLCHGDRVVEVITGHEDVSKCDAVVTHNTNVPLGITTADCGPICFADKDQIGIAHVGWRGLCLGLVEKMLERFDSDSLEVFVGPHLHQFEIQKDFCYDAITHKFGETFLSDENGHIVFRFKDAIASCLPSTTVFDERSTGEDSLLPSYRKDKTKVRILTTVRFVS
jgi:copper oxidase (laccase) domain-containing protein